MTNHQLNEQVLALKTVKARDKNPIRVKEGKPSLQYLPRDMDRCLYAALWDKYFEGSDMLVSRGQVCS